MKHGRPRFDLGGWLMQVWKQLPFVRRRGGSGLAGVREPRRPRQPFRPPQAMSADPRAEDFYRSPAGTIVRPARRWWRRRPRARHA